MASEEAPAPTCLPVRARIRIYALVLWLILSVPSICVTLILNLFSVPTDHTVHGHNQVPVHKIYIPTSSNFYLKK
jgi:hypothetical protein